MFTILTAGTVAAATLSTAIAGCADQRRRIEYRHRNEESHQMPYHDHRTPYHGQHQHNYYHGGRTQPAYAWYPWHKKPHRGFVPMSPNGTFNREYPCQPAMSGPLNLFKPAMTFDDDWHMEAGQTDMFAPMGMFDTGFNRIFDSDFGRITEPTFGFDRPHSPFQGFGNPPCRCGMLLCDKCMGRKTHF